MPTVTAEGKASSLSQEKRRGPAIWLVLDLDPKKRGSMEQQLLALAAQLRDDGALATFVFNRPPPAWLDDGLSDRGVDVRVLDFRRPARAAFQFLGWVSVARPELVHFHFVRAYSPLVVIAHAAGARVILHDHMTLGQPVIPVRKRSQLEQELVSCYKRARASLLNRLIDLRVAVSRFVATSVRESEHCAGEQQQVVENGIDLSRFLAADGAGLRAELRAAARPVIVCISRLTPDKGVDVLIRALARVGRDALLLLVGDGFEEAKYRALAASLGLQDHVRFLGLRNDVERVLAAADVVVTPSLWDEAFGLCVVEAMATGRPVVVTRAGAMPEIVDEGRCGLIVPKGDDVALAGAIGRLLDDPALAARLGEAGRQRARQAYGLQTFVTRMSAVYRALVPSLRAPVDAPPLLRAA